MKTITDYWRTQFVELQKRFSEEMKKNNSDKQELRDKILDQSVKIKELESKIGELEKTVSSKEKTIGELEAETNSLIKKHKDGIIVLNNENLENIRLVEEKRNVKETVLISEFVRFLKKDIGYVDGLVRVLDEICKKKDERAVVKSLIMHTEWIAHLAEELSWFAIPFIREDGTAKPDVMLEEVLSGFGKITLEKNIKISKEIHEGLPEISIYPEHLKSVFTEIIKNAFDAMPDGGTLTISMKVTDESQRLSASKSAFISVVFTDTGRGIPEHLLRKIEKPFFSTKKNAGFGLGMTRVKKILDTYNGQLDISSEEDRGTVVDITFPAGLYASGDKKKDTDDKKAVSVNENADVNDRNKDTADKPPPPPSP